MSNYIRETEMYLYNPNLQPREKAMQYGIGVLSDRELLKVMIGSGQKGCSVDQIASRLLELMDRQEGMPSLEELQEIRGMGMARSALIAASLEYSRRHFLPGHKRISKPENIHALLAHMADRQQEYFFTISLNGAHEHIRTRQVSQGLVNRTIVHPREVFAGPLQDRCASICVAHNHPSGNLEPSPEDREITVRLQDAGEILGIPVLDHIIFSPKGYVSFQEEGWMDL